MSTLVAWTGNACYGGLALVALWGAFCSILIWRRVAQIRFRTQTEQADFLRKIDESLAAGDFDGAARLCADDPRAVPQLAALAIANRDVGFAKVRALVIDHFQRDVLADLEYRMSWVYTMIKSAPMLGLYGTVLGMMGAFDQLNQGTRVEPQELAGNISLALVTTAIGLTIAIPLILCTNSINVRIRKLEDLVGYGLTRVLESLKTGMTNAGAWEK